MQEEQVAVVPAAGLGTRLGLGPKAFLSLDGVSLLDRVADVLGGVFRRVIVALPADNEPAAHPRGGVEVIRGGGSRHETIARLLAHTEERYLLIHDVARPFASRALVERVLAASRRYGAACAFTEAVVPAAIREGASVVSSIPRKDYLLPQSPQAYHRDVLTEAFDRAREDGIEYQATWDMISASGQRIHLVHGEETNIKLTTPLDWAIARYAVLPILENRNREMQ